MQKNISIIPLGKILAQVGSVMIIILLIVAITAKAKANITYPDTSISASLKSRLAKDASLNYPLTVKRFYRQTSYRLAWIAPDTVKSNAWDAMLLLDCVLHYGLSPSDYHLKRLLYERLNAMMAKNEKVSNRQKVEYDILLTDAIITMINNLHYGKLNPVFTPAMLDKGNLGDCRAAEVLMRSLKQKDFKTAIQNTQPVSKAYYSFQYHMRLVLGQQAGDCYEIPEGDIRLMAINMERLRWINRNDSVYISIDIPTYTLKLHQKDTTYQFKVLIGKPETPTPLLQSRVLAIIGNRSGIMFKLSDNSLTMTGTSVTGKQASRALSDGTVWVTNAPHLAALLLKNNQKALSADNPNTKITGKAVRQYALKKPMPVRVTYLTCAIGELGLIRYKDIYNLDQRLIASFYQPPKIIARR